MHGIVFTQLYHSETLKIPACFNPTGIIFSTSTVPAFFANTCCPQNCMLLFRILLHMYIYPTRSSLQFTSKLFLMTHDASGITNYK